MTTTVIITHINEYIKATRIPETKVKKEYIHTTNGQCNAFSAGMMLENIQTGKTNKAPGSFTACIPLLKAPSTVFLGPLSPQSSLTICH